MVPGMCVFKAPRTQPRSSVRWCPQLPTQVASWLPVVELYWNERMNDVHKRMILSRYSRK